MDQEGMPGWEGEEGCPPLPSLGGWGCQGAKMGVQEGRGWGEVGRADAPLWVGKGLAQQGAGGAGPRDTWEHAGAAGA